MTEQTLEEALEEIDKQHQKRVEEIWMLIKKKPEKVEFT
jgi:hypothetical protein